MNPSPRPPIFRLDSREPWRPVGVEESLRATDARVPAGFPAPELVNAPAGDRLDFPAGMKQPDLPVVGYCRARRAAGLDWLQWWLWYVYNSKRYVGFGEHEGDFEYVQVAYADAEPVLVTASQHATGGKAEYWACEQHDGRLVVYVARDSHANYLRPTRSAEDIADGAGPELAEIEWRPFGDWAAWPGRWGNSTEQGKSPSSPAKQGDRWHRPHLFHSQARS